MCDGGDGDYDFDGVVEIAAVLLSISGKLKRPNRRGGRGEKERELLTLDSR